MTFMQNNCLCVHCPGSNGHFQITAQIFFSSVCGSDEELLETILYFKLYSSRNIFADEQNPLSLSRGVSAKQSPDIQMFRKLIPVKKEVEASQHQINLEVHPDLFL